MATATIDNVTTDIGAALPSRLIPGAQCSLGRLARKKAASATIGPGFWEWREPDESVRSAAHPTWQNFFETVLPQPATRNQRAWLAMAVLADFLAIALGFAICAVFWQQASYLEGQSSLFASTAVGPCILYGIIFTLLGYSERLYHPETLQAPQRENSLLGKVVVWSTVLVIGAQFFSPLSRVDLGILAASSPISFMLMLAVRERRRKSEHEVGAESKNVLIVGAGKLGQDLARHLERNRSRHRVVRGFLDENQPLGGNVYGRVGDLARVARCHFVDEVIVTLPPDSEAAKHVISQARRNQIDVKVVPDVFGFDPAALTLEKIGNVPILSLCEEHIPHLGLFIKRHLDLVVSSFVLLLTAPLLAAIALAIKLDSPGPVLYRATRLGRKGQRFQCCKFRTMITGADRLKEKLRQSNEREGAFFKIADDPRITRVGRILRRYSLDELPQLWNVVRGEMSLVGPRPHPLDDFERYRVEDLQRLEITPGLTGLWQVTARRDPSFERSMSLDRAYIAGWNLWLDFKILCKTTLVVLRGEGS